MAKAADAVESIAGKERLLATAMRLFAEKGFDGVTVRDLSAAASVSVGLINHHFGSKEGLREAVDRYFLSQFEEVLLDSRPALGARADNSAESFADWLDDWIARHVDSWDMSKAYMRRAILEGSDWGAGLFERFYQVVRTSVDRLDAEGGIRPDVDRLWLPLLIVYLDLGTLLLEPYVERVLGKSGFDRALWSRRHRAYVDLLVRGISPLDRIKKLAEGTN